MHLEIEVPVFKKFLFCLPLKCSVFTWAIIQAVAVLAITIRAIVHYLQVMHLRIIAPLTVMLVVAFIVGVVEITFANKLAVAAYKRNCRLLNVTYRYFTIKVVVYAILLAIGLILPLMVHTSDLWYYYNVDPVRYYLLMGNVAVGVIDCLCQGYLTLLIRSLILEYGGTPKVNFLAYERLENEPVQANIEAPLPPLKEKQISA